MVQEFRIQLDAQQLGPKRQAHIRLANSDDHHHEPQRSKLRNHNDHRLQPVKMVSKSFTKLFIRPEVFLLHCPRVMLHFRLNPPHRPLPKHRPILTFTTNHPPSLYRSATQQPSSSPPNPLALAALTSVSPSKTPVKPPKPSMAGSWSAPKPT